MTVETLSKAYEINLEIQKVKEKIKECQYTQFEDVTPRDVIVLVNGHSNAFTLPKSLFRMIGKLAICEYQQNLIELEAEFESI